MPPPVVVAGDHVASVYDRIDILVRREECAFAWDRKPSGAPVIGIKNPDDEAGTSDEQLFGWLWQQEAPQEGPQV